jgi:hypothetical protein
VNRGRGQPNALGASRDRRIVNRLHVAMALQARKIASTASTAV